MSADQQHPQQPSEQPGTAQPAAKNGKSKKDAQARQAKQTQADQAKQSEQAKRAARTAKAEREDLARATAARDRAAARGKDGRIAGRREPARRESGRPSSRSGSRSIMRRPGLDTPLDSRRSLRGPIVDSETFGRWSETFARFMGTAWFLVGMTVFVGGWLAWNALAPVGLQFDPRQQNFTLMTLILSLQASYAAPLILLAQNRQADRDRVTAEQDRDRAERALADTEYLAREVAALRIALGEVATRDFVRSELRALLDEASVVRKQGRKNGAPAERPPSNHRSPAPEVSTSSNNPARNARPAENEPPAELDPSGATDSFGSTPELELPTERG